MSKIQKCGVFLLLFWIFSFATFADNKRYQIELLVFSHITPAGLQSEFWPIVAGIPQSNDQQTSPAFAPVDANQFFLQSEAKRLARLPDYRVLYHAAWIVSAKNLNSTKTIYINNDKQSSELNGLLRISLSNYFNIDFQLSLNELTSTLQTFAKNPAFSQAPSTFHFILGQKRRMRSKELNYVGHPLFGALIKIIPITSETTSAKS